MRRGIVNQRQRRPAEPKVSLLENKDAREHRRYAVAETFLRVTWLDAKGDPKIENLVRPIDVSETGMAVELPEPALLLSRIRLESGKGDCLVRIRRGADARSPEPPAEDFDQPPVARQACDLRASDRLRQKRKVRRRGVRDADVDPIDRKVDENLGQNPVNG